MPSAPQRRPTKSRKGTPPQIAGRQIGQAGFHAQVFQTVGKPEDDRNEQDGHDQRHAKALPDDVPAFFPFARAAQLRRDRRDRQQNPLKKKHQGNPQRAGQGHGRHVFRPHAAGHHHVHKAH